MKAASYAAVYCALYPELAEVCRSHGYALAVHGSMQRDFDVIAIPWVESPSEPDAVVAEITKRFVLRQIGDPDTTFHGRRRYTLSIGFGECAVDMQFMPILTGAA